MGALALVAVLALGAPEGPKPPGQRAKVVRRIDRAHIVGSPVLDARARPGLYVWRERGRFRFAVVGPATTRFHIRTSKPLTVTGEDGMVWRRIGPRHWVGRAPGGGSGAVDTPGQLRVGRVRRAGRRARIYVGPLAEKAAKTVDIGAYGAVKK